MNDKYKRLTLITLILLSLCLPVLGLRNPPDAPEDTVVTDSIQDTAVTLDKLAPEVDENFLDTAEGYTRTQVDATIEAYIDPSDYYTQTETNNLLDDKADVITTYTKVEVDATVEAYAYPKADVYTQTETDNLLDDKANATDVYTKAETDSTIETYAYSETETDNLLDDKADIVSAGTEDNLVSLDASGNIKDSGSAVSDFASASDVYTKAETDSTIEAYIDPADYYTQTNMQTSGQAQLHWDNVTNKPAIGTGDMEKSTYDTNDDGIVNQADTITDLDSTVENIIDAYSYNSTEVYTQTETDNLLDDKADTTTTYTKAETDSTIETYAYSKSEIDTALANYALGDLSDVNVSAPSDNDVLTYDTASGEWTSEAIASGTNTSEVETIIDSYSYNSTEVYTKDEQQIIYPDVLNAWVAAGILPIAPSTGDRYACLVAGNGWTAGNIYEYNGASWDETITTDNSQVLFTDDTKGVPMAEGWYQKDSTTGVYIPTGNYILQSLDNLSDVDASTYPGFDDAYLRYAHTPGEWTVEVWNKDLAGLSDVNVSAPSDNDVLTYDGGTGEWTSEVIPAVDAYTKAQTDSTIEAYTYSQAVIDGKIRTDAEIEGVIDSYSYNSTEVYTQTELDNGQLDNRYYTESETYTKAEADSTIETAIAAIDLDLNDLGDVNVASPEDGEALVYDSGTGEWTSEAVAGTTYWDADGDDIVNNNVGNVKVDSLEITGYASLPTTSGQYVGVISQNGERLLHTYTGSGSSLFLGVQAGNFTQTGQSNIGIGSYTLQDVTSGYNNTGIGAYAGTEITEGFSNVGVGYNSLNTVTTGDENTAIGSLALADCNSNKNTAIGYNSLTNITSGNANTALGYRAGYTNTTGSNNIFLGNDAGYYETGSNKLFIDIYPRDSESNARDTSLIYGIFDNSVANQKLYLNAGSVEVEGTLKAVYLEGQYVGLTDEVNTILSSVTLDDLSDVDVSNPSDNDVLTYDDASGEWTSEAVAGGVFEEDSDVVRESDTTYNNDFVFGSPTLNRQIHATKDRRFFFDDSKAAFRAGYCNSVNWDDANRGSWSAAFGDDCAASDSYAFAAGYASDATADAAVAMGYQSQATNNYATAIGYQCEVAGWGGVALGYGNNANGGNGVALGCNATVDSSADNSMLINLAASSSTLSQDNTLAIMRGKVGIADLTPSYELSVGGTVEATALRSDTINPPSGTLEVSGTIEATAFHGGSGSFDLFQDGSGNLVLSDGVTGDKTLAELAAGGGGTSYWEKAGTVVRANSSEVTYSTDDFVWGSPQLADDGDSDHDYRFFFDKSKGAFRAGRSSSTDWDDANIGFLSNALGYNTKASGIYSFAVGNQADATGAYSLSIGSGSTASGANSVALGASNTARSANSIALGAGIIVGTTDSDAQYSIGFSLDYNTTPTLTQASTMAIMGGKVGINDLAPAEVLDVDGNINITGVYKIDDVELVIPTVKSGTDEINASMGTYTTTEVSFSTAFGSDDVIVTITPKSYYSGMSWMYIGGSFGVQEADKDGFIYYVVDNTGGSREITWTATEASNP